MKNQLKQHGEERVTSGRKRGAIRVLLIDSPRGELAAVHDTLARNESRMACLVAPDGIAGVASLGRYVPDVIVLDAEVRGIDLEALLSYLFREPRFWRTRLLLLSPPGTQVAVGAPLPARGIERVLTKPVDSRTLWAAIRTCLADRCGRATTGSSPDSDQTGRPDQNSDGATSRQSGPPGNVIAFRAGRVDPEAGGAAESIRESSGRGETNGYSEPEATPGSNAALGPDVSSWQASASTFHPSGGAEVAAGVSPAEVRVKQSRAGGDARPYPAVDGTKVKAQASASTPDVASWQEVAHVPDFALRPDVAKDEGGLEQGDASDPSVVGAFVAHAEQALARLARAMFRGENEIVAGLAFAVEKEARSVGRQEISALARKLSACSREGNTTSAIRAFFELYDALEQLIMADEQRRLELEHFDADDLEIEGEGASPAEIDLTDIGPIVQELRIAVRRRNLTRVLDISVRLMDVAQMHHWRQVWGLTAQLRKHAKRTDLEAMQKTFYALLNMLGVAL